MVNPNNPTGSFLKRAELDRLDSLAAERGLAIGFEGFLPRDAEVFIVLADAAGVGVFEDGDGGSDKIEDDVGGGFDIEDVGI